MQQIIDENFAVLKSESLAASNLYIYQKLLKARRDLPIIILLCRRLSQVYKTTSLLQT